LLFIANTEKAAMMKNTDADPVRSVFLGFFIWNFPAEKLGSRAKMHK